MSGRSSFNRLKPRAHYRWRWCLTAALTMTCPSFAQGPASAAVEGLFCRADSALCALSERPESRMKEVAPVEELFTAALSVRPEFGLIARTNSRGLVVNVISRGDSSVQKNTDVSIRDWHDAPLSSRRPYYGPPFEENKEWRVYWSRPIMVRNSVGTMRFGGVVTAKINLTVLLKRFAAESKDPFEIVYKGKSIFSLSWKNPDAYEEKPLHVPGIGGLSYRAVLKKRQRAVSDEDSTTAVTPTDKIEALVEKAVDTTSSSTPRSVRQAKEPIRETASSNSGIALPEAKASSGNSGLLRMIVDNKIAMGLAGSFIIISIISGALFFRKRKYMAQPFQRAEGGPPNPDIDADRELAPEGMVERSDGPVIETARPEDLTTQAPEEVLEEAPDEVKEEVRAAVREELKQTIMQSESDAMTSSIRAELEKEIRSEVRRVETEAIRAAVESELTDAWREEIRERHRQAVYERELETLKKLVHEKLLEKEMPLLVQSHRSELSRDIRQKLVETCSEEIKQTERGALREEIARDLRQTEFEALIKEEREKLRTLVQGETAEKETAAITARTREELTERIRAEVKEEAESVRARARDEMEGSIRQELKERDYETLFARERELLAQRIRNEIIEKDLPAIHDELLRQVSREEQKRVDESERAGIIEAERIRLREVEGPALREEIRAALREEESMAMHAAIKAEIYTETVQSIKTGLEEKYKTAFDLKLEESKEAHEKKVRGEVKGSIKTQYQQLLEHAEKISQSMASIEALDSLSQTVALLGEEKKKYKYFNLNTAQTESLLDYLKRVHNRFNIFIDKLDGGVREIALKINAVMNALDEEK